MGEVTSIQHYLWQHEYGHGPLILSNPLTHGGKISRYFVYLAGHWIIKLCHYLAWIPG